MLNYHYGMNRIKEFRDKAGLSQAALAELINTSAPQLNRLEKDRRELTVDWLNRLAKPLNCHPWELAWENTEAKTIEVPISGYTGAGSVIDPVEDLADSEHPDTVDAPAALGRAVAVIVKGGSMLPVYQEGDIIFYRQWRGHISDIIGKECIIRLQDGRVYLKKLLQGSSDNLFTLYSYNAEPMLDQHIDWAGPVLWVRRND